MKTPNIFSQAGKGAYTFELPGANLPEQEFYSKKNVLLGYVEGSTVTVLEAYAWNGASPRLSFKLFGKRFRIGTPNGKKQRHWVNGKKRYEPALYYVTLEHDFLTQFMPVGVTLGMIRHRFDLAMRKANWKYRKVYLYGVDMWFTLSRKKRKER